jgi:hypothetical protein
MILRPVPIRTHSWIFHQLARAEHFGPFLLRHHYPSPLAPKAIRYLRIYNCGCPAVPPHRRFDGNGQSFSSSDLLEELQCLRYNET